jgi:hypothetical protein
MSAIYQLRCITIEERLAETRGRLLIPELNRSTSYVPAIPFNVWFSLFVKKGKPNEVTRYQFKLRNSFDLMLILI